MTDQDFNGDLVEGVRVAGTVGYQQPDGSWQRVAPAFPGNEPIRSNGRVQDRVYRRDLARQLLDSEQLARAFVNRLWLQLFRYGLTMPVDDLGRQGFEVHSELLDELAEEFVSSGWDVHQLTRWILLSDPFTRSHVITEANARCAIRRFHTAVQPDVLSPRFLFRSS